MTPIFPRRGLGNLRGLARLAADRSGNVAIIYALMAVVLMLAIGAAVDISRWLHARDQTIEKIAILMTDGEYNTQYDSNGIAVNQNAYPTCSSAANGCSTTQARSLCSAMKAQGIVVYTIGQTAIDTLNQCATEPGKFYSADNGDQLKQAFRDIALKLTSLYLSK